MSLNFDSAHFQTSFPTWEGVFRVAVAAAVAPVDYVLAGMVAAGLGAEAISLYLGLARTALFERLVELGLPAPHDRPLRRAGGRNPWSTDDVRQLIGWWVAGIHVRSIAEGLGRSRSAIYAKRRRLGLPDRERKRLVYRTLSELAAASWDSGAPPRPGDDVAPLHHGVGASVKPLLPLASDLGSGVAEPVVVTGGALVAPVQGSMFDAFEAAQSSKAVSPAGLDQFEGEPQPSVEEASQPEDTASFPSEPQTESAPGRSRDMRRNRPAGLSAAIDELRRFCKTTQGPGDEPDWKRLKVSEEFILELVLRAFAAQSREGIARDMGITASMAANRVSRLDIMRRRRNLVDEFNIEAALENLATSGLVARTCKGLKRLFFVRKGDSRRFCRDWDKIQKRREKGDGRKEMEKTARTTDKPQITLPILKWMKRPFPILEGEDDKLCGGQASPA
jgi:hypothetical protein